MMGNKLDELLKAIAEAECISKVYSASSHANAAKTVMNHLVDINLDWKNTLLFLSEYPVHKWAIKQRDIIGLDTQTLTELLIKTEETPEYFGINSEKIAKYQKDVLSATEKLSSLIDSTLKRDKYNISKGFQAYQALHGNGSDVSTYIFNQYYEIYMTKICIDISAKVNSCFNKLRDNRNSIDPEIRLVYHDARLLLSIKDDIQRGAQKEEILKSMNQKKIYRQINGYDVYDTICYCINSLSKYPFSGKEVMNVMKYMYSGYSEEDTAAALGRSRTYIRSKEEEGIHAIDCLIWGMNV